jgi:hypothetical protein
MQIRGLPLLLRASKLDYRPSGVCRQRSVIDESGGAARTAIGLGAFCLDENSRLIHLRQNRIGVLGPHKASDEFGARPVS